VCQNSLEFGRAAQVLGRGYTKGAEQRHGNADKGTVILMKNRCRRSRRSEAVVRLSTGIRMLEA
jgi:hypothetical protein